MTEQL
jgi:hypothetical protein